MIDDIRLFYLSTHSLDNRDSNGNECHYSYVIHRVPKNRDRWMRFAFFSFSDAWLSHVEQKNDDDDDDDVQREEEKSEHLDPEIIA